MAATLAVLNTQGHLGNPDWSQRLVDKILSFDADLVVMPEAFNRGDEQFGTFGTAMEQFQQAGYEYYKQANDDTDGRADQRGIAVINRIPAGEPYTIDMLTRSAIGWSFRDPDDGNCVNVAAVHLDDRTEATRVAQAEVIADMTRGIYTDITIAESVNCPDADWVDLGDINSPHSTDIGARLLRALGPVALRIPHGIPGLEKNKIRRLGSILQRGVPATAGGAIAELEAAGLTDADPRHRTTSRLVPFALDHILYPPSLRASGFKRIKIPKELSDHHAIKVTVER